MSQAKTAWDKKRIQDLIATNDKAVERAVIRIWENQTADEQSQMTTNRDNGIGFTGADAEFLTKMAQWLFRSARPEGKRFTYGQMKVVRPLMSKYWRQLRDVIITKETEQKEEELVSYAYSDQ